MTKKEIKKLDSLWANAVKSRANYHCEYCGVGDKQIHACHIIGRRYRSTRWNTKNGMALCSHHHRQYDEHGPLHNDILNHVVGKRRWLNLLRVKEVIAQDQDFEKIKIALMRIKIIIFALLSLFWIYPADAAIRGMKITPGDPYSTRFLNEGERASPDFFWVGVAVPENQWWVNLDYWSEGRAMTTALAGTQLGRTLLDADVQLKKMDDPELIAAYKKMMQLIYADLIFLTGSEKIGMSVDLTMLRRLTIRPVSIAIQRDAQTIYINDFRLALDVEFVPSDYSDLYKGHYNRTMRLAINAQLNQGRQYAELREAFCQLILASWFKSQFPDFSLTDARKIRPYYADEVDAENVKRGIFDSLRRYEITVRGKNYTLEKSIAVGGIGFDQAPEIWLEHEIEGDFVESDAEVEKEETDATFQLDEEETSEEEGDDSAGVDFRKIWKRY